jgi:hypothetical protein
VLIVCGKLCLWKTNFWGGVEQNQSKSHSLDWSIGVCQGNFTSHRTILTWLNFCSWKIAGPGLLSFFLTLAQNLNLTGKPRKLLSTGDTKISHRRRRDELPELWMAYTPLCGVSVGTFSSGSTCWSSHDLLWLRSSTTWAKSPCLFAFVFFLNRILHFPPRLAWTWTAILLAPPHSKNHRCAPPCQVYWLRWWSLANFSPRLVWNYCTPNLCFLSSWDYRHEPTVLYLAEMFHILICVLAAQLYMTYKNLLIYKL